MNDESFQSRAHQKLATKKKTPMSSGGNFILTLKIGNELIQ